MAILHESANDAAHGALAPERLIVTPKARLVVVDYALGSALEQLLYSRDRYWTSLRVALPRVAGLPRFDHLADVTQIGVVALSLILGRPLRDDEYPGKLAEVVGGARARSTNGEWEPLPRVLIQWLERATQLDPRNSFPSAIHARVGFDKVVDECGYEMSPSRLNALLARYLGGAPATALSIPPSIEGEPGPFGLKPPPPISDLEAIEEPFASAAELRVESARRGWRGGLVAATAVAAVLLGSGATMAARRFLADKPQTFTTGTLILKTDPAGVPASVDGAPRGMTPLKLKLSAGPHSLTLRGAHGSRDVSVTIVAGEQLAQFVDLPKETAAAVERPLVPVPGPPAQVVPPPAEGAPVAGWLVVTGPFDVMVYEHGKLLGSSESDRIMVETGPHDLELANEELGYLVRRSVQVAAGKVAQVALDPPSGSISLNALPWAEVWVDGDKIGDTPLRNVALSIGGHDVVFRHPDLGEQRHRVTVTLKDPARLSVDLRKK